jgi:hypothetical protein
MNAVKQYAQWICMCFAFSAALGACFTVAAQGAPPASSLKACGGDFTGAWDSSYGLMTLTQAGDKVTGDYAYGAGGTIDGVCASGRLTFRYLERPATDGEGWFELTPDGLKLKGQWRQKGQTNWGPWEAKRGAPSPSPAFHGLFDSSFGRLRLVRSGDKVTGLYHGTTEGALEGEVKGTKLTFRWTEERSKGEGWFEASPDGKTIQGKWRSDGVTAWGDWEGVAATPIPGVRWLIIVESQWEESLIENEYAFGDMLRSYFERVPNVQVRHRRVRQASDLLAVTRDLALLAEPTALWLSGHGDAAGLSLAGDPIDHTTLAPALALAPNVFIVHFASCAVMSGDVPKKLRAALPKGRALAISGYATPVDWTASAVLEILYLDLLLARSTPPADAVRIVRDEVRFSGDSPTPGSPFGALMLRLVE